MIENMSADDLKFSETGGDHESTITPLGNNYIVNINAKYTNEQEIWFHLHCCSSIK